jgi:hypothetical protein
MEKWQAKVHANSEATERWTRKLLRAATELSKLRAERKRLMAGPKGKLKLARPGGLAEIPRMAGGGSDFSDEIPG